MINLLFKVIGVAMIAISAFVAWHWMGISQFADQPIGLTEPVDFDWPRGAYLRDVAQQLEQQKIIDNAQYLVWLARFESLDRNIKAGEYQISGELTPRTLLQHFVKGQVKQYALTVIEGWTFQQLMSALREHPKIKQTLQDTTGLAVMATIDRPGEHPEGQFLPDTYHFPRGTSDVSFLRRANVALHRVLNEAWQNRRLDLPYKTPYEVLIMASIVEKETAISAERPQIAGVFVRRLQKNMRLQTDPTVIYGMGDRYQGNLRRKDLRRDTPYNTYVRKGLTPTPIALPSRHAIQAALNPAEGDTLYFVAKGNGFHYFSKTLGEHNQAVKTYQLTPCKNYRSYPPPSVAQHESVQESSCLSP